jgi:predicted ATPase
MGQLTASRSHLERAVGLYDPSLAQGLTVRFGLDAGAGAHAYLNLVLTLLGYPERAVTAGHTALHMARNLSHPFMLGYTLSYVAQGDLIRRSAHSAEGYASEAEGLCRQHGLALQPHVRSLRAVAQAGAVPAERLVGEMSEALDALADQHAASGLPTFLAWFAELCGTCGRVNEGLDSIDRALSTAGRHGERYFEAEIHRLRGSLLVKHDPPREAEAEQAFLRAIDVARGQEARWWELRASVSLGRLWQRQGRSDEARSLVANVYDWFTEGFDTVDLLDARALLDELA